MFQDTNILRQVIGKIRNRPNIHLRLFCRISIRKGTNNRGQSSVHRTQFVSCNRKAIEIVNGSGLKQKIVCMLLRLPNGLAVEPILIRKKFIKWQDEHPEFTRIVFHGLRHSSATYQLMISGGDVKAVQGTTGHASANLLVNTYAHIQQDSRKKLGKKFEEGFYKPGATLVQAAPVEAEPTISVSALVELLKDADPAVKAQLHLALLT